MLWAKVDCDSCFMATKRLQQQVVYLERRVKAAPTWGVYTGTLQNLADMLVTLPLVQDLRDEAMRERHWKKLMRICGKSFVMDDKFSLSMLLAPSRGVRSPVALPMLAPSRGMRSRSLPPLPLPRRPVSPHPSGVRPRPQGAGALAWAESLGRYRCKIGEVCPLQVDARHLRPRVQFPDTARLRAGMI